MQWHEQCCGCDAAMAAPWMKLEAPGHDWMTEGVNALAG